ncbi:hypothetical protein [Catenulispora rubra]|uniref:hypothetical protein n=1 Tax=Catenulispora rubra TaxID=280293 RepID=UPI0018926C30|nr:hypothetical protein [Catenulispora rubra]
MEQTRRRSHPLEGIADHHLATGETDSGIAYLNQALEIFQCLGMRPEIERVQTRLAGFRRR